MTCLEVYTYSESGLLPHPHLRPLHACKATQRGIYCQLPLLQNDEDVLLLSSTAAKRLINKDGGVWCS